MDLINPPVVRLPQLKRLRVNAIYIRVERLLARIEITLEYACTGGGSIQDCVIIIAKVHSVPKQAASRLPGENHIYRLAPGAIGRAWVPGLRRLLPEGLQHEPVIRPAVAHVDAKDVYHTGLLVAVVVGPGVCSVVERNTRLHTARR